jgi:ORF6N domain
MSKSIVPVDRIAQSIYLLRGQKVMLDSDLAALYGVTTKVLNQAVKRNRNRFPDDFMFRLNTDEVERLIFQFGTSKTPHGPRTNRSRSQIVTLKRGQNIKYLPYVFTEQGVAMLSSVLNSERAVKVNIAIMRAFVKLRETLETNRELARKFEELERYVGKHDEEIAAILEAIRQLMAPSKTARREIGFHVREKSARYRTRNGR